MSIKVYNAWKIPVEKLHDFEKDTKPKIRQELADKVWETIRHLKPEKTLQRIKNEGKVSYFRENPEWCCETYIFETVMDDFFKPYNKTTEKTPWDIECGWSVRVTEDFSVLKPYGPQHFFDIEVPNYADDFSYWNNTGKPDEISEEEWEKRKEFWREYGFGTSLSINIFNLYGINSNSFDLKQDFIRQKFKNSDLLDKHVDYVKNNL